MKAINHGGGHRGWLIAITAVSSVLILAMALFLGGCGGSDQGADSGSQLDEGAENSSDMQGVGSIGGAPGDEGQDGSAGGDSGAAVGDSGTGDGSVSQGLYGPEGPLGDGASSSGGSQSATPGTNNGSQIGRAHV